MKTIKNKYIFIFKVVTIFSKKRKEKKESWYQNKKISCFPKTTNWKWLIFKKSTVLKQMECYQWIRDHEFNLRGSRLYKKLIGILA